jgi:hypothetical protein
MKGCNALILFFLIILVTSTGTPCPIKLERHNDGSIQFNSVTGVQFKLEPKQGKSGWAKIRHFSILGDHPWSWIPMDKAGRLVSYAKLNSNNKTPIAEMSFTPAEAKGIGTLDFKIKADPFNSNDKRWIAVNYKNGDLTCYQPVIQEDIIQLQELNSESPSNFGFIEVYSPNAIYAGLGLL